jgi:hypothetical protein
MATSRVRDRKHQVKVVSFLATLPSKSLAASKPNDRKIGTLQRFAQGASAAGDQGVLHVAQVYEPCDVAVILGWVHEHGKDAPHLRFRQHILDQQRARGGRTVIADSNLFLYQDQDNPHYYLRYSFDGVFPNTGCYCDDRAEDSRWQQIQQHMGVSLKPWRTQGGHILLCLQREGGWSMGGVGVVDWAVDTIQKIRTVTKRHIMIRVHPGDKKSGRYIQDITRRCDKNNLRRISVSEPGRSFLADLDNTWAVVNHNSSPAVGAAIEGVPVFVTDPVRSQAREVANLDLQQIENPACPDREAWVRRISQFHWSHVELSDGSCWRHMRQWTS